MLCIYRDNPARHLVLSRMIGCMIRCVIKDLDRRACPANQKGCFEYKNYKLDTIYNELEERERDEINTRA